MKPTTLPFFVFMLAALTSLVFAADRDVCLAGIVEKESRGDFNAIGRKGERGLYQFRRTTWSMETKADFRLAHTFLAHDVAIAHFDRIVRSFESAGVPVTEFNVAMAWNAGIEGVISGRAPVVAYRYAADVCRINDQIRAKRAQLTPKFTIEVASVAEIPRTKVFPSLRVTQSAPLKFDFPPGPILALSGSTLRLN